MNPATIVRPLCNCLGPVGIQLASALGDIDYVVEASPGASMIGWLIQVNLDSNILYYYINSDMEFYRLRRIYWDGPKVVLDNRELSFMAVDGTINEDVIELAKIAIKSYINNLTKEHK